MKYCVNGNVGELLCEVMDASIRHPGSSQRLFPTFNSLNRHLWAWIPHMRHCMVNT